MSRTSIISLNQSEIEQAYAVFIHDKQLLTTVTSIDDNAGEWIRFIQLAYVAQPLRLIVGLDLKFGTPEDDDEDEPPLALLSLCVYRSCLIFELTYANAIPLSLHQFFSDQNNTFVGVGIQPKLLQLQREYDLGEGARHHDLGSTVAERYNRPDLANAGVGQLRTFLHGSDVQRPQVAAAWDVAELSNEHAHHATIDAFTCYELGSYLVYPIYKGVD